MTNLPDVRLFELMPSSIRDDPKFQAAAGVLDAELQAVTLSIPLILIYARIDELEEPLLSHLAWQFHVDYWDSEWNDETKRRAVKESLPMHFFKGTPWAVENGVEIATGMNAEVEEWFDYDGDPYRFKVAIPEFLLDYDPTWKAILSSKNVRSWLDAIQVHQRKESTIYAGGVVIKGVRRKVRPRFEPLDRSGDVGVGGVIHCARKRTVYPANPGPHDVAPAQISVGGVVHICRRKTIRMVEL